MKHDNQALYGSDYGEGTEKVLVDVWDEREAQFKRFGPQDIPDGTGGLGRECEASKARRLCEIATQAGDLTYADILTEEFWEALAETDPKRLREELVQVAAVACAWVEAIDRRQKS